MSDGIPKNKITSQNTIAQHEYEDQASAKRVVLVDLNGEFISVGSGGPGSSPSNPIYAQLTDGSITIGTVNAELEVQLSHLDNFSAPGDIHDSLRVGGASGNEAEVNASNELLVRDDDANTTLQATNALLTTIRDNADQVESLLTDIGNNTDGLEALITASNSLLTQIRDNADTVESLLGTTNSLLTSIDANTDGLEALITATNALLTTIRDNADTVETQLAAINANTDGLETLITASNALLTAIRDNADTVETLLSTANASLSSIDGKMNSLGQKLMSGSMPVVLASDHSDIPVILKGHRFSVLSSATLTTSGVVSIPNDLGDCAELTLMVRIDGPVTGGSPSITFTLFDMDLTGNLTGNSTSIGPFTSAVTSQFVIHIPKTGRVQLTYTITGTTPSFGGVSVGINLVLAPNRLRDANGAAVTIGQKVAASSLPVVLASDQTLPLPSGAATAANQATEITSLQLIDDLPHAMNAAFNKAAAIAGQLDDTSTTAATEDNIAPVRITAQRAIHVNFRNNAGTEIGTATNPVRTDPTGTTTQPISGTVSANQGTPTAVASAWPTKVTDGTNTAAVKASSTPAVAADPALVVALSPNNPLLVSQNSSSFATYSASTLRLVTAALATDIFTITGSATKIIKIKKIRITATRSGNTTTDIALIKRSTANTGGTSAVEASVPHDSASAAATAVVRSYTANPTVGTPVGTIRTQKQFINVIATRTSDVIEWNFGQDTSQPIVLRGVTQVLAINLLGVTVTTPSFDIFVEYTEE